MKQMLIVVQDATPFELGGIKDALEKIGLADNYRIVLKSDHVGVEQPVSQPPSVTPASAPAGLIMSQLKVGARYMINLPKQPKFHGLKGELIRRNRTRVELRMDAGQIQTGTVTCYPSHLQPI